MLRVLVETVKYRLWIALLLFSTRDLDSRPILLVGLVHLRSVPVPEAFAVALGEFDGG